VQIPYSVTLFKRERENMKYSASIAFHDVRVYFEVNGKTLEEAFNITKERLASFNMQKAVIESLTPMRDDREY
jgi:hypothetical protein